MSRPRLVLITDPRYPIEHLVRTVLAVRDALPAGSLLVQHRDKVSSAVVRDRAAAQLRACGVPVAINGTPEDARRLGADAVHLPGEEPDIGHARRVLGDDAWVSIPAHDDAAVLRALTGRATAALVSPIYAAEGKGAPRGVAAIERACATAEGRVAIYALGGIDPRRAASCATAGAHGVAVIRAVFDAPDPSEVALALVAPFGPPCR